MNKINQLLNKFYFGYLGALPALATFFLIQKIAGINNNRGMILFLIGTIIVAVYLAFIMSYLKPIKNNRFLIITIIDGPIFALIGSLNYIDIPHIIITTFFIENIAIWLSISVLAYRSQEANKEQKIGSQVLALLSITGLCSMYYAAGFFTQTRYRYIPLLGGMIQTILIAYKTLKEDEVVNDNIGFIIGFLFLRIASMSISIAIYHN